MSGVIIVFYCGECVYTRDLKGEPSDKCHHGRFLKPSSWGRKIPDEHFNSLGEGIENMPNWCPL